MFAGSYRILVTSYFTHIQVYIIRVDSISISTTKMFISKNSCYFSTCIGYSTHGIHPAFTLDLSGALYLPYLRHVGLLCRPVLPWPRFSEPLDGWLVGRWDILGCGTLLGRGISSQACQLGRRPNLFMGCEVALASF
jgi:hypothetical protein